MSGVLTHCALVVLICLAVPAGYCQDGVQPRPELAAQRGTASGFLSVPTKTLVPATAKPRPWVQASPGTKASLAPITEVPRAPTTIRVDPAGEVRTIAEAARLARDGDTVEVKAGEYLGDVAVWRQKKLTIRAVGGPAVLLADGKAAEEKAIWVFRNGEFEIEGFDFVGARVRDMNGAGIRFERGSLKVRDSRFRDNESGILTGNDRASTLILYRCAFTGNGHPSGQSHSLYAGQIARLEVRESYFSSAKGGHLLKTRAQVNEIFYNRITDEQGGIASYELEFPNGGDARVIGNLIEQAPTTRNSTIVSYGAEGYMWDSDRLLLAHNTIVNRREGGGSFFLRVFKVGAEVVAANNLFVGRGGVFVPGKLEQAGNARPSFRDFVDPTGYDYRPKPEAHFNRQSAHFDMREYTPVIAVDRAYRHPLQSVPIAPNTTLVPGAFQR